MGIGNTRLHKFLQNGRLLSEALAWYSVFDAQTSKTILDWVRNDQLFNKGVDSEGETIGFYTPFTEMINPQKEAGEPYTLKDTGQLYRSLYIVALRDAFVIEGDTAKIEDQDWFSDKILSLTDQSKEKLKPIILEKYKQHIREVLHRA